MPKGKRGTHDIRLGFKVGDKVARADGMNVGLTGQVAEGKFVNGEAWYRVRYDDGVVGQWVKQDELAAVTEGQVRHG